MAEETRAGGCHCGAVRFRVDIDLGGAIQCNCSICTKKGIIWAFAPLEKFTLEQGAERQAEYLFNKHVIHHRFCTTCGTEAYAEGVGPGGARTAAINVRCLDDIDLAALHPKPFDGRSL